MNQQTTIDILNRLHSIHARSLPMYLGYASPWSRNGDEGPETLRTIVADQKECVERISEMVIELDGAVRHGGFPMHFTGLHDLSFDYLLTRLIEHQKKDIAAIESCVAALDGAPLAKALAEECLGAAKGHLDSLVELQQQKSPAQ